ncbi:Gypsy retrotransposon integrase-like protein 1 [Marasmius tenuissimus]|nr:Gypsy retrotransposon integrase-like protein 1 [Marasmius tenuissimus]
MPGAICSHCIACKIECTHAIVKKKGIPSVSGLPVDEHDKAIDSLVDKILSTTKQYLPEDPRIIRQNLVDLATYIRHLTRELDGHSASVTSRPRSQTRASPLSTREEDEAVTQLDQHFKLLNIERTQSRYFGTSSRIMLVQNAMEIKKEFSKQEASEALSRSKRLPMWEMEEWQQMPEVPRNPLSFPEIDLMNELVHLYFVNFNVFFPLLHRPTFVNLVTNGVYLHDYYVGATVLAVCALGSRYSNDPRVFYPGSTSQHSVGWRWIKQLQLMPTTFLYPPSLYQVQAYILVMQFTNTTTTPEHPWLLTSFGIRLCEDIGIHRKGRGNTIEAELWRRAFWSLIMVDVIVSQIVGRPQAIIAAHYDLEYPVECDDEYWDHPDERVAWKQPENKPAQASCWVWMLKLLEILASTDQTIYSLKRSGGQTQDKKQLAHLDSRLEQWLSDLPEHLRWDPNREDPLFFQQSILLYNVYYWAQIQIHRPFLPRPGRFSVSEYPSLGVCSSAGRSCVGVIDTMRRRGHQVPIGIMVTAVFTAATILLINAWMLRIEKMPVDLKSELADIYRCLDFLRSLEYRQYSTRRPLKRAHAYSQFDGSSRNLNESGRVEPGRSLRVAPRGIQLPEVVPHFTTGVATFRHPPHISEVRGVPPAFARAQEGGFDSSPLGIDPFDYHDGSERLQDFVTSTTYPFSGTDGYGGLGGGVNLPFGDAEGGDIGGFLRSINEGHEATSVTERYDDWDSYLSAVDQLLHYMERQA